MGDPERRRTVAEHLAVVRDRIGTACKRAGRQPEEVTLIAITKTFPASDVRLLAELGVSDVGENRDQEARRKHQQCATMTGMPPVTWHFVGQVQTNKARSVATYADVVHSVDRPALLPALERSASAAGRTLRCLIQLRLDDGAGRAGVAPSELESLADQAAAMPSLRLCGVMAIAPLGADPRPAFERLSNLSVRLRTTHPDAWWISAGMSLDLEAAIESGATHVRVGRGLLGERSTHG